MGNIILKDEKNVGLTLNSLGNIFSDAKYSIVQSVCSDVFCNCGSSVISIVKEEDKSVSEIGIQIPIDVHSNLLREKDHEDYSIKNPENEYIVDLFKESLTELDWDLLRDKYYQNKFALSEQVNPREVDFNFGREYGEMDGMMFPYRLALPCSEFRLNIEGSKYVIVDDYCKTPNCDCKDVYLTIISLTKDEVNEESAEIGNCLYNYETKSISEIEEKHTGQINTILKELKQEFLLVNKIIERRHSVVKTLFHKFKLNNRLKEEKNNSFLKKVGMNELCPCGSGKKYKKCCLGTRYK